MKIQVVIHPAKEGGFWAEVPSLPGCFSQGRTMEEMLANIKEAIECYLEPEDGPPLELPGDAQVREVEI